MKNLLDDQIKPSQKHSKKYSSLSRGGSGGTRSCNCEAMISARASRSQRPVGEVRSRLEDEHELFFLVGQSFVSEGLQADIVLLGHFSSIIAEQGK